MDMIWGMIPVPNNMLSRCHSRCVLAFALLGFSLPAAAQFTGAQRTCIVVEDDANGSWTASRHVNAETGAPTAFSERYEWKPNEKIPFGQGMTMNWSLSYTWPKGSTAQTRILDDEILLDMGFWFDAKEIGKPLKAPSRTGMHLYRHGDPQKQFSFTSISMTTGMLWSRYNNGNVSTRAIMPLGDVLAFGTGMDTLVWNIRGEPDELGRTFAEFRGTLPVAMMRDKGARIPDLRRKLDRKAKRFRTECHVPMVMVEG